MLKEDVQVWTTNGEKKYPISFVNYKKSLNKLLFTVN